MYEGVWSVCICNEYYVCVCVSASTSECMCIV